MRHILYFLSSLFICAAIFSSCEEDATIGTSLIQDQVAVTVDSSFTVSGYTVNIDSIQSRTVSKLIGRIEADGYGRLQSDFVTQFMPASSLDTANITVEGIDSLVLVMNVASGDYVGDSITPMGIEVYKLDRLLPSPIYSNFDPEDYYSKSDLLGKAVYNTSWLSNISSSSSTYTSIRVPMPLDMAKEIYTKYMSNPETFSSPTAFADKVFPGVYIRNSYGSGRLTRITTTLMSLYYHYTYTNPTTLQDSVISTSGNYFAVTPEIVSNNNIHLNISDNIRQMVNAGDNILLAPAGLEVEMKFPAREILEKYRAEQSNVKVLNSLTFSVPAEYIENDFNMAPPNYVLMVLKKDKKSFFANNTLPDNVTSFYATYNSTTGEYNFGEMRSYIMSLLDKAELTEDDYTFTITPVSASFETSQSTSSYYYYYYYGSSASTSTLSMLTPYVATPTMTRLRLDEAKIKLTFSSQTIAN